MQFQLTIHSLEEMNQFSYLLAKYVTSGQLITLEGDLGAGKTTFTKGFAKGLGIQKVIKSPTYTLIREYTDGKYPLYHMDMYRLEEIGGGDLGIEEYLQGDGIVIIEWAKFIEEELPIERMTIEIDRMNTVEEGRIVRVSSNDQSANRTLEKFYNEWMMTNE